MASETPSSGMSPSPSPPPPPSGEVSSLDPTVPAPDTSFYLHSSDNQIFKTPLQFLSCFGLLTDAIKADPDEHHLYLPSTKSPVVTLCLQWGKLRATEGQRQPPIAKPITATTCRGAGVLPAYADFLESLSLADCLEMCFAAVYLRCPDLERIALVPPALAVNGRTFLETDTIIKQKMRPRALHSRQGLPARTAMVGPMCPTHRQRGIARQRNAADIIHPRD